MCEPARPSPLEVKSPLLFLRTGEPLLLLFPSPISVSPPPVTAPNSPSHCLVSWGRVHAGMS